MTRINAQQYIDTRRYPINETGSDRYRTMVAGIQAQLNDVGCAVMTGFIRPERIGDFIAEADRVADKGHRSFNRTNVYFSKDDESLAPGHPVRRFYDRSNAFVPADNFDENSPLRAIYEWPPFMPFVQHVLDENSFYRYADPLADVIINVVEEGDGFPWHFDTNNYTVTLAIQNGDQVGSLSMRPISERLPVRTMPAYRPFWTATSRVSAPSNSIPATYRYSRAGIRCIGCHRSAVTSAATWGFSHSSISPAWLPRLSVPGNSTAAHCRCIMNLRIGAVTYSRTSSLSEPGVNLLRRPDNGCHFLLFLNLTFAKKSNLKSYLSQTFWKSTRFSRMPCGDPLNPGLTTHEDAVPASP